VWSLEPISFFRLILLWHRGNIWKAAMVVKNSLSFAISRTVTRNG
jgi:hypothetical protein